MPRRCGEASGGTGVRCSALTCEPSQLKACGACVALNEGAASTPAPTQREQLLRLWPGQLRRGGARKLIPTTRGHVPGGQARHLSHHRIRRCSRRSNHVPLSERELQRNKPCAKEEIPAKASASCLTTTRESRGGLMGSIQVSCKGNCCLAEAQYLLAADATPVSWLQRLPRSNMHGQLD